MLVVQPRGVESILAKLNQLMVKLREKKSSLCFYWFNLNLDALYLEYYYYT